ncbi:MAG: hypothetical protein ACP5QA_15700 [Phycisphaerae bacterium]
MVGPSWSAGGAPGVGVGDLVLDVDGLCLSVGDLVLDADGL